MSFLDRFETTLREAGSRYAEHNPPASQPTPKRHRRSRRYLAISLAGLAVAGSATAAVTTHPWSPTLGDDRYGDPEPTISADAPPQDQMAILGVLRRPYTAADRDRLSRATLQFMNGKSTHGVRTDYIRRLGTTSGGAVTLIPIKRWDPRPDVLVIDGLCLFYPEPNGDGGGKSCWTTMQIKGGYAYSQLGSHVYGLVPDGVTEVVVEFGEGGSATAQVRDNFFDAAATGINGPPTVIWRDSEGRTVEPYRSPRAHARKRALQAAVARAHRHPRSGRRP